jgi:hypothetical protein
MTPPQPEPRPGLPDSIAAGVGFAIACDLVLFGLIAAVFGTALLAFGLLEWIGLLPIYLVARKQGCRKTAKGVLIVGFIVFLLQAACYGIILLVVGVGNMH